MRLKVVHVIPALRQGGAEKLLFDLVSNHDPTVDVAVITLLQEKPFFNFDPGTVRSLALRRALGAFLMLPAMLRLRRMIKEHKPDVIHAWLYHGNLFSLAAIGLGIPIIWSIHNTTLSSKYSKRLTRWANFICARVSKRVASRIVYCTRSARELHERMGYDAARGLVIANGINVAAFAFDPEGRRRMRQSIGAADEDVVVGCVARFDPQKNHAQVIAAFAKAFPDGRAMLVLAGRECTAENAQLVAWLRKDRVDDRTRLLGERHDMPAVMSALDVLVSASRYGEALPLAVIEAAAVGLPIITTDVGEIRGLVLDPSHVVTAGNTDAMALALRQLRDHGLSHAWDARKAERNARVMRDYAIADTIARYHALYRAVAAVREVPAAPAPLAGD